MSLDPVESMLTTGDYHRLGVRESEARPRVIRHAAHQLAEPLVRRHLVAPDGQTEADLVEVVISTYRLLDPRRRATAVERVLLTQQEPVRAVEPRWAHPKALASRKAASAGGRQFNAVHFESIPADSSTLFPESVLRNPQSPLANALVRLATVRDRLRRYRHTAWRAKWYLWIGPAVVVLSLILLRPMFNGDAVNSTPGPVKPAESSVTPAEATSSFPLSAGKTRVKQADLVRSETSRDGDPAAQRTGLMSSASSTADVPSAPVAVSEPADRDEPNSDESATDESATDESATDESATDESATQLVKMEGAGSANGPDFTQTTDVRAEQAAAETMIEADRSKPEGDTAVSQQPDPIDPLAVAPRRAPLPSPAELEKSRSRLQKLLADRPEPVTEAQQIREVEWLLDLRQDSPPGSADALAIAQFAVGKLVAAGRHLQGAAIVEELENRFDAEDAQIALLTTEQLAATAGSLADHHRIVAWCLTLSEKYLQAELFDGAMEMARLGTLSAVKLGDGELRSRLGQHRDAISTARRTSESVWEITERASPNSATATDAAQVGRYLCLMIRNWEQGVTWLANSSDVRLAAAAQQEILLNETPDRQIDAEDDLPAIDGGTVANQWLEASDRFRGRLGESAKLHAYQLVSRAMEASVGLRTLELKKQLDALREQLPGDLVPLQADTVPAANRLAGGAGGQQAMLAASGVMEGRLMLNGRDTGTLIRYSPGVQLRQNVIDQIFGVLQQPVAPWTLTFEGILRLEKAATIRFIAAGPTAPAGETTLRVNSNRLPLVESVRGRSAAVDLTAGVHRVTWQISGANLEEAFVLIQDEVSGERLELAAPPAHLNALPVRLRIDIQRAP